MMQGSGTHGLLVSGDPVPFDIFNPHGTSPVALVCEHAGQTIPSALGDLGVAREALDDHIGWDIGAGTVARLLANRLDAVAILQPYSRLVIDCNRPPHAADAIPPVSDGVPIPANQTVGPAERAMRVSQIFEPFHGQIDRYLDSGRYTVALSVHSFTPRMNNVERPWDVGFLFRDDRATSQCLMESISCRYPDILIGMNEPYQVSDMSDWFVPRHGEARNMRHSLVEIRNDHIRTAEGQKRWAGILADAIGDLLEQMEKNDSYS